MKYIANYVKMIDEELEGAKCYAEKYVEFKAKGDATWANRFKEMANQEIQHSMWLHDLTVSEIEKLREVFVPPAEMLDKWDKAHIEYVEKAAWVKQMLAM